MTYGEILAQIISEITGRPKGKIIEIVKAIENVFPDKQRLTQEIPEDKVDQVLQELRKEKPAIIAQLMEYDMLTNHHREGNA